MGRRLLVIGVVAGLVGSARGQEEGDAGLRAELAELTRAFETAFNEADPAKLGALFTDDAKLVTDEDEAIRGREAIVERFRQILSEAPRLTIACESTWIEPLGPDSAIEEGVATLRLKDQPEGPGESAPYTAIYAKRDGEWKHLLVRDHPRTAGSGSAGRREALAELRFLQGEWIGEGPNGLLKVKGTTTGEFIHLKYSAQVEGVEQLSGEFRIGWDASVGRLKAWEFNSTGAFGEGTWTRLGDNRWLTQSRLTSAEGEESEATRILERLDAHRLSWRRLDGESPIGDAIILTWRPPLPGTAARTDRPEPSRDEESPR